MNAAQLQAFLLHVLYSLFLFISPLAFSILHKNTLSKSVLAYLGITAIYATNQHSLTLNTWWEAIMLHNKNIKQKLFRSLSFICLHRRETSPPYITMRQQLPSSWNKHRMFLSTYVIKGLRNRGISVVQPHDIRSAHPNPGTHGACTCTAARGTEQKLKTGLALSLPSCYLGIAVSGRRAPCKDTWIRIRSTRWITK